MSLPLPPPPGPDDAIASPESNETDLVGSAPHDRRADAASPAPRAAPSARTEVGASEARASEVGDSEVGDSEVGDTEASPPEVTKSQKPVRHRPRPTEVKPLIPALAIATTVVHVLMAAVGVVIDDDTVRNGVAVVSVMLFFLGALSFMVAFVIAAGRSRYEDLWFGGAFFLTGGVVAARARLVLMGCLGVQCAVGLLGASLAPFTPVAFVVLVPMAAMGLMSLYGARWGEFSTKQEGD